VNLFYGQIAEVFMEDGMLFGRIRVDGALKKVSLNLISGPLIGDRILVCDGVAIAKVQTVENEYVSSDPW
jgi:hydrogenase maturation factor